MAEFAKVITSVLCFTGLVVTVILIGTGMCGQVPAPSEPKARLVEQGADFLTRKSHPSPEVIGLRTRDVENAVFLRRAGTCYSLSWGWKETGANTCSTVMDVVDCETLKGERVVDIDK